MHYLLEQQHLIAGVVGGIFFSSIVHFGTEDLISTVVLAIIGAVVSFTASLLMKRLVKARKKQGKK